MYLSIILFFVLCYLFGYSISFFVKGAENFLERHIMRLGFGLGAVPFTALLLNAIGIDADYRILLGIGLIAPIVMAFRNKKSILNLEMPKLSITHSTIYALVAIVLFGISFYVYSHGAFSYPYLEDDDPWSHANGVKFVSIEKNVYDEATKNIRYINPYPPSYDLFLGIIHQTNDSVSWTMKFFTSLIISLSILFFYFFATLLFGDRRIGLLCAFFLSSVPGYLSHFIWAISFTVPLYFVAFYCFEKIKENYLWAITGGVISSTALLSSPTHSTYFGFFCVLYLLGRFVIERRIPYWHLASFFGAVMFAILFWITPMLLTHGLYGTLNGLGFSAKVGYEVASVAGTGDRAYSFTDFFFAKGQNLINNPIGIGAILFFLFLFGIGILFFKKIDLIKKNRIVVGLFCALAFIFMTLFLYFTYVNKLYVNKDSLFTPSTPFMSFFSSQFFIIFFLAIFLSLMICYAIFLFKKEEIADPQMMIVLLWLLFSFYAVNAATYHFKLSPFRAWAVFVIPLCLIAGYGALQLIRIVESLSSPLGSMKIGVSFLVVVLLIFGVYQTSMKQKIEINSAQWPPGAFWTSNDEIISYLWLKDTLPKNTKVFTFSRDDQLIGNDMYSCRWCDDVLEYKKIAFNQSTEEFYTWLKKEEYQYLIVDGRVAQQEGAERTNEKISSLSDSAKFTPVFGNSGGVVLKIN